MQVVLPNRSTPHLQHPRQQVVNFSFFISLVFPFTQPRPSSPIQLIADLTEATSPLNRSSQIGQPRDLRTDTSPLGTQWKGVNIIEVNGEWMAISPSHSSFGSHRGPALPPHTPSWPPFLFSHIVYQASSSVHLTMEWTLPSTF